MHRLEHQQGHPDCIVIGGGIIGLSIARRLAGDGLSVTILERGRWGEEASWAGAGVLVPCNPHRRDGISAFRDRSLALFPDFCASLCDETGIDSEYEECGELEIALDEDSRRSLRENETVGAGERLADGTPAYHWCSVEDASRLEPKVSGSILGALECRRTAQVRNPRTLKALIASCRRRGVRMEEGVLVQELVVRNGRVVGVRTESGDVMGRFTILCAGAWSALIAPLAKVVPVHPVRGQLILMKFDARPFTRVIARGKTYLVPRRDGHVLLGATQEHDGSFSKRNTASGIAGLIQTAVKLVPSVANATLITQWTGLRPGTPDDNPYMGPVPGFDGLIAATGHFRAGLILAPITAEIVSRLVHNQKVDDDLSACMPGR